MEVESKSDAAESATPLSALDGHPWPRPTTSSPSRVDTQPHPPSRASTRTHHEPQKRSSCPLLAIRKTIARGASAAERASTRLQLSFRSYEGVPSVGSLLYSAPRRQPAQRTTSISTVAAAMSWSFGTAGLVVRALSLPPSCARGYSKRRSPLDNDGQPHLYAPRLGISTGPSPHHHPIFAVAATPAESVSPPAALKHTSPRYPPSPTSYPTSTLSFERRRRSAASPHPWRLPGPPVVCISSSRRHRRRPVITHPHYPLAHWDAVALAHRRYAVVAYAVRMRGSREAGRAAARLRRREWRRRTLPAASGPYNRRAASHSRRHKPVLAVSVTEAKASPATLSWTSSWMARQSSVSRHSATPSSPAFAPRDLLPLGFRPVTIEHRRLR
ncbi:hypothetical protein HMN09_00863500 [Mycena chlorophos]|uniref:Uncharacterized protein n=1 Tax=Mycena chlorophos TaxID=658473 RepID=A0A8H6W3S4_MYCCL|nr:hypothetical protein HMN09_00863500 [Mycena chlorophos]